MSFHIQFNNVSAYNVSSPLIKKPGKGLGFKDVGSGIWKIVDTSFYKNPSYAPVFLLLMGIDVCRAGHRVGI